MSWNYLKIAWRILLKNRTHTLINIIGLGLGYSVFVMMLIFVYYQLSFDNFHENSDRIYRMTIKGSLADQKELSAAFTSGETGQHILEKVPETEMFCRVYNWGISEVIADDIRFTDDQVLWADSTFFNIFTFRTEQGNPALALKKPFSVVLTRSSAQKYFGDTNPVNKIISIRGLDYQVTAIMEDPPANSHLQFDMLASFHSLEQPDNNIVERSGITFPTYLLKKEGTDTGVFEEKATGVADRIFHERYAQYGMTGNHGLQPLKRIYLYSGFGFDTALTGHIRNVYIFSFLALAVIVIAIFNFVNLVTSQSEKRMREIGIRKVLGAFRKHLVFQFMGESLLVSIFAFLLSLMFNELFINGFSSLLDADFRLEYWHNPAMFGGIVLLVMITGIVAGIYPALYLSGFQPVVVLKGLTNSSYASQLIRKVLVIFQFTISIFLITSVLLLNRQVHYMQDKDLGFARENVVSVRGITQSIRNAYPALKAELEQNPSVLAVTASQDVVGENMTLQNFRRATDHPNAAIMLYENRIQHDYVKTFGMQIVEGRDFDPDMGTDHDAIIINQATARLMGMTNPVGEEVIIWEKKGRVIGVVADFHFQSLHNGIDPLAFTLYDPWITRISIRMTPQNRAKTMDWIKDKFEDTDPNYSFEYFFVDDKFTQMYSHEENLNKLTGAAAIIAIIISFMGLFALTSFSINKKFKEIGIRKTLGASLSQILHLLFRDLWRWILIGNLIAWPMAAYVVSRWMENFAYRISLADHWYLFLLAGALAAIVGTGAAFSQAWSAARMNPVDSLKTE